MLETLTDVPEGVVGVRLTGRLTAADYDEVVGPLVEDAERRGGGIRLLVVMGPEYEGFTAGAARAKADVWWHHPGLWRAFDGYALVSDLPWVREVVHLAGFLVPFPLRVFGSAERDAALAWLTALPHHTGVHHG